MKSFKNILILTALFFASFLAAETLERSETLRDNETVIPAGSERIVGEDGIVQYMNADGDIIAQTTTTVNVNGVATIKIATPGANGEWKEVTVTINGSNVSKSNAITVPAPLPLALPEGEIVGGSPNTGTLGGVQVNNPATNI